jgi:hypothetical protein
LYLPLIYIDQDLLECPLFDFRALPLREKLGNKITKLISFLFGLAETNSINNRSMIKRITNNKILRPEDGLKKSSISIKSTWEKDTVLKAIVISDNFLKIFMDILSSTDETN